MDDCKQPMVGWRRQRQCRFPWLVLGFNDRVRGVVMRTKHSIRVPEGLWAMAKAKASDEHTTVTAIIIEALKAYTK